MNGLIFRDVFRVVSCCSSTCCTTCTCMLERESIVESTPSRDLNVATNSSLKCMHMIVPGVYSRQTISRSPPFKFDTSTIDAWRYNNMRTGRRIPYSMYVGILYFQYTGRTSCGSITNFQKFKARNVDKDLHDT